MAEVLRINDRYVREVIERFNLCPFARRGRERRKIVREVLAERGAGFERSLELLELLEQSPEEDVEMGIFIYPCFEGDLAHFRRFALAIMDAHTRRFGLERRFVGVVFHPDWPLRTESPAALVPWLRRSPDPSVQWTRRSTLTRVRRALPAGPFGDRGLVRTDAHSPVSAAVARANYAFVVEQGGRARIEAALEAIGRDRLQRYAPWLAPREGERQTRTHERASEPT